MEKSEETWYKIRIKNLKVYFDMIAKEIIRKYTPNNLLDIGCADGLFFESFQKLGIRELYGIDNCKESLCRISNKIQSNCYNVDIENEKLPFETNTFDVVTNLETLEHLHNHRKILYEMNRVIKPNGIIIMSSPMPITEKIYGNPDHINIHSKRFWIKEFEKCNSRFKSDFKKDSKEIIKEAVKLLPARHKIAKFLMRFGKYGEDMRIELGYQFWTNILVFEKEKQKGDIR